MLPIIGVFPNIENNAKSSVMKTYVDAIENAGGMCVMLPYTDNPQVIKKFISLCDGFIFTGGVDIDPINYGEFISEPTVEICTMRDKIEFSGFAFAYESKKPILAICRGCQLINVALGGSLYQDIESQYTSDVKHKSESGNYSHAHEVTLKKGTLLHKLAARERIHVNSMHHQAIKTLGRGLIAEAISEDGIIEAVYMPEAKFIHAVQWHPERTVCSDSYSQGIFDAFVAAAKHEN